MDGRLRPLGIAALEDKIARRASVEVQSAVYEADCLGVSHGFRPGLGPQDAPGALGVGIERTKMNSVLGADFRDFSTSLDHTRLASGEGSPHGATISPLLANVYLLRTIAEPAPHHRREQAADERPCRGHHQGQPPEDGGS